MLNAVMFGWKSFQPIIEMIEKLAKAVNKPKMELAKPAFDKATLKKANVRSGLR